MGDDGEGVPSDAVRSALAGAMFNHETRKPTSPVRNGTALARKLRLGRARSRRHAIGWYTGGGFGRSGVVSGSVRTSAPTPRPRLRLPAARTVGDVAPSRTGSSPETRSCHWSDDRAMQPCSLEAPRANMRAWSSPAECLRSDGLYNSLCVSALPECPRTVVATPRSIPITRRPPWQEKKSPQGRGASMASR